VSSFVELLTRQLRADLAALPQRRRRWSAAERVARCANIADLRELARRAVPGPVFDYVDGAAGDEVTARRNRDDLDRVTLVPKVLTDVSRIDLGTTVLGQRVALPLLGAPTGLTGLVNHEGEAAIARAVHAAGSVYIASTVASYSIEELAAVAPGPTWFQLYVWRDRGLVRAMVERARAAGHLALVVTADVPRAGARERDVRSGFSVPPRITLRSLASGAVRPRWSADFIRRPRLTFGNVAGTAGAPSDAMLLSGVINSQFDPTLSWSDLAWLREEWTGPLVVKGILHPDDARQAVALGVDGIVVSNHGGRQLDHAVSSIAALPAVVDAVEDTAEVYFDGGVRRGVDVAKALAAGARACLAGRALVYGVGAGGQAGATRAVQILADELALAMTLLGCPAVRDLDGSFLGATGGAALGAAPPPPR
jgi:L-lactate dehydrogenase (cytochrome)